jgi:protein gp37
VGKATSIGWTDSTFNPWWGCAKAGPECANCFAEVFDRRTGGDHWGPRKTPRVMSDRYWREPMRWQRDATASNVRRKVFCGSMCDWADKNAPELQRDRLWALIRETPILDWQLLTKRAPNIVKCLPDDWGDGYPNVWLGVSVGDRKHGLPRIEHLRRIPARIRFLSIEPLLEDLGELNLDGIHWVIIGGESGWHSRPMKAEWVDNIVRQCVATGVRVFFKQWGGHAQDKGGCLLKGVEFKEVPKVHDAILATLWQSNIAGAGQAERRHG